MIGKLEEDFEDSLRYIAIKRNLPELVRNLHQASNQTPPGEKLNQRARILKYFSMLNIGTRRRLYEIYKVDFEMFGYDYKSFL